MVSVGKYAKYEDSVNILGNKPMAQETDLKCVDKIGTMRSKGEREESKQQKGKRRRYHSNWNRDVHPFF